jgi:hypothetical protein
MTFFSEVSSLAGAVRPVASSFGVPQRAGQGESEPAEVSPSPFGGPEDGRPRTRRRFDETVLTALHRSAIEQVLRQLALDLKPDPTYASRKNFGSRQ